VKIISYLAFVARYQLLIILLGIHQILTGGYLKFLMLIFSDCIKNIH